jgi:Dynamin GTPase effector domain
MYCGWENSRPFTQNDDYMEYLRARISEYMCRHRYANTNRVPGPFPVDPNIAPPPAPVGLERLFGEYPDGAQFWTSEKLFEFYQGDPHRQLLDIVTYAAAYFRVACKRVIDLVPMCIENQYLSNFGMALKDNLEIDLGVFSEDSREICARLTVEEPDARKRRADLNRLKSTILDGLKIMGELTAT